MYDYDGINKNYQVLGNIAFWLEMRERQPGMRKGT